MESTKLSKISLKDYEQDWNLTQLPKLQKNIYGLCMKYKNQFDRLQDDLASLTERLNLLKEKIEERSG